MQTGTALLRVAPAFAALAILLAGCSDGGGAGAPEAGVASLAGQAPQASASGAAQASTSAEIDSRRPQLRVDTSDAEKERLLGVWGLCLKSKGVPTYEKDTSDTGTRLVLTEARPADYPAQFKACADKQPVWPAALDPNRNPHYAEDNRNWLKCINRESPIKVVEADPDIGPRADPQAYSSASAAARKEFDEKFERIYTECQYEAFGRG